MVRPQIIDGFTFFNEIELLDIRLNSLDKYVDEFILVESMMTHSGKKKPLYFDTVKDSFSKFNITYVVLEHLEGNDNWERENFQRNCIAPYINNRSKSDILLISDIDEIPDLSSYNFDVGAFSHRNYYYYLNTFSGENNWSGTVAATVDNVNEHSPQYFREARWTLPVIGRGWHFSTIGTAEKVIEKVEAFAHQEFNLQHIKDNMQNNIEKLSDPYNRTDRKLSVEEPSGPPYLLANKDKFKDLFYDHRPNISLVMIVKNEEEILDRCLQSVSTIIDEYIIVDTGSTDQTESIIEKYGKVYKAPFTNYVDTKNEALKLATGKYILFMDADEVLSDNATMLLPYVNDGTDAVSCKIIEHECEYNRTRLWRNTGEWKFDGPGVHEVIRGPGVVKFDNSVFVNHLHDKSDKVNEYAEKFPKYIKLLKDAILKDPTNSRAWFYLGRTYKDLRDNLNAVTAYFKYLTLDSCFRDEIWQASYDIAVCFGDMGEYDKSFEWCEKAINVDPRRAEAWNHKGLLYFKLSNIVEATKCYEEAIKKDKPNDITLFLNPIEYTVTPFEMLSTCYRMLNRYEESEIVHTELIRNAPGNEQYMYDLSIIRSLRSPKVFMVLGDTPELVWGGVIEERGVHGVETTYLELSEELVRIGCEVYLFCSTKQSHKYKGVYYVPNSEIENYSGYSPHIVISSRDTKCIDLFDCKKVLWLQDAGIFDNERADIFSKVDLIVCSSNWHKTFLAQQYYGAIDLEKVRVIPLGIRKNLFTNNKQSNTPLKFIYSSNPNRGLFILLNWWNSITDEYPDSSLDIFYGWESTSSWSSNVGYLRRINEEKNFVYNKADEFKNINISGRITKRELANSMMSSGILTYPNTFIETFCLSALEAQAAGMIVITTDMAALSTTVNRSNNFLICKDPTTEEYRKDFFNYLGKAVEYNTFNKLSSNNRELTLSSKTDWSDIANDWINLIWGLI